MCFQKDGMTQGCSVTANNEAYDELQSAWNGKLFTLVFTRARRAVLSPRFAVHQKSSYVALRMRSVVVWHLH